MENRRTFIAKAAGSLLAASLANLTRGEEPTGKQRKSLATFDPYRNVDWDRWRQVVSVSHMHVTNQKQLNKAYDAMDIRHLPISNYYPSAPCYPAADMKVDQYRAGQNFGVMRNKRFVEGPIDWNRIIMDDETGWFHELPAKEKKQLPFKKGPALFTRLPSDLIISPNAEHHGFTNTRLHANSLGSLFGSGTFDRDGAFRTAKHGYRRGTGLPWKKAFAKMLDQLLFANAGGITINHPTWSRLSFDETCAMLDFDRRVLGLEVYNDTCANGFGDPVLGWAYSLWDRILRTGRRCFGFFTPDHAVKGRNIIVVPRFDEHECLKAYRQGAFYGVVDDTGLRFTNITLAEKTLRVAINRKGTIRLASNRGQALKKRTVNQVEYEIPIDNAGKPKITFIRAEAFDETGEKIFSQAIMF